MPTVIEGSNSAPAQAARHDASFLSRLTTGTGAFDVLGRRRYYYIFSSILVLASILFIVFRGFHFGIDFAGGTRLTFQPGVGSNPSVSELAKVFQGAAGTEGTPQTVGQQRTVQISSSPLDAAHLAAAKSALTSAFHPVGPISDAAVSGTWGSEISFRAVIAVLIFLVLVGVFIWIRYEKRVAFGAVASTIHDLIVTAGIYAAVGFEVSPSTVIGLLTILGFSLYDTVVVYDKVQENTKGLTSLTRRTYPEAANLAVNQTLMRSINTSLIALLPVAGLLIAGVALLGSGTLKDLSLVLLVGMLVGAYSSVFVAVPLAVDLKIREPQIRIHTAKVLAKRKADGLIVDSDGDPVGRKGGPGPVVSGAADRPGGAVAQKTGTAPRPGVKPARPGRPAAKPSPAKAAAPASAPAKAAAPVKAPAPAKPAVTEGPSITPAPPELPAGPGVSDLTMPAATPAAVPGKPPGKRPARPTGKAARPSGKRAR